MTDKYNLLLTITIVFTAIFILGSYVLSLMVMSQMKKVKSFIIKISKSDLTTLGQKYYKIYSIFLVLAIGCFVFLMGLIGYLAFFK